MKIIGIIIIIIFSIVGTRIVTGWQMPMIMQLVLSVVGGVIGVLLVVLDKKGSNNECRD